MKANKYADLVIGLILLSLGGIAAFVYFNTPKTIPPPTHDRIIYLRDSLEMEYYRKAIEHSYPFDHSKIPTTHESNP